MNGLVLVILLIGLASGQEGTQELKKEDSPLPSVEEFPKADALLARGSGPSNPQPPPPPPPPPNESPPPKSSASSPSKSGTDFRYPRDYDPMFSRIGPPSNFNPDGDSYVITQERLSQIREPLMYPYYDGGVQDEFWGENDYQDNFNSGTSLLDKKLNFLLPFFGFAFNYTWISLNGYVGFSDNLRVIRSYPLHFPTETWPHDNDPSFMGPFFSECRIGLLRGDEANLKKPGVYFRVERDLQARKDQFGVELRERLRWDIREGMIGSEIFTPKHAFIVTWKNVTFNGGQKPNALYVTNTFQLVVTTDEVMTYAMFNYEWLGWTTHTGAGGSSDDGQGGTPAYVGFNAGNGSRAFEYKPFSQLTTIRDLTSTGNANGKPGRHMFRVDEKIYPGSCNPDPQGTNLPLVFAPENGNMLGGTVVNVTGPCFTPGQRVTCRFEDWDVEGIVVDSNRASCVMPRMSISGYIDFAVSQDGGPYYWKGKFFVETPMLAPEGIWFTNLEYQSKNPGLVHIQWAKFNLTKDESAKVQISIWGYKEDTIDPKLYWIDMIEEGTSNTGDYKIIPQDFVGRNNRELSDFTFGMIQVNLTDPLSVLKLKNTPVLWSKPIPLGWYFAPQWRRRYGDNWANALCNNWISVDRAMKLFTYEIPKCPCLIEQAVAAKGYFAPDLECDKDGNTECLWHQGAQHCIRSGMANKDAAGQQCCYDREGYLMMTTDTQWGGNPHRAHDFGMIPYYEANKVPTLSHYYHDIIPFYFCCMWQHEQSEGCTSFRFERRISQDCVGYQPPGTAAVYGDPHFHTFDDTEYTFNGKGEFVLVRANSNKQKLDVQGRFEAVHPNRLHESKATMLTSIAARDNVSSTVEVRLRPKEGQWRYRLDVIVDHRFFYFDRYPQKIQAFKGVTVYVPTNILNQSHVVVMFQSGAGIEVVENRGYLTARVYLPLSFINQTRGLFGNWSFNMEDDFQLPEDDPNNYLSMDMSNLDRIHNAFGMKWILDDKEDPYKGKSLFYHEHGKSSNFYFDETFLPEMDIEPEIPTNVTLTPSEVRKFCGESYQCYFDYAVTMDREFAKWSKHYQDEFVNIKKYGLRKVTSCGALPIPKHGRKSTFAFTVGTEVKFDCDPGFILTGERRRWCYATGEWSHPEEGRSYCMPEDEFYARQAGITSGIVLAVIVPIVVLAVCFLLTIRKRRRERVEGMGERERFMKAPPPVAFSTPAFSHSPRSDPSPPSSQSDHSRPTSSPDSANPRTTVEPRFRGGAYYTGEPLPNKLNAEFYDYDEGDSTHSSRTE
ncbi:unnamed protein product [Darwinula stevensoni]|uniref:Protein mesh n=1 Tax=Darwinula stevensoni TaxID=69355 RepID=A0A7R8X602_9CRUS|nr:unnamed protein product [Darwinula stevensoni]CAG0885412.1 unnamed protein product [Darwinula stevensoni]